jgi:hypothetical protein
MRFRNWIVLIVNATVVTLVIIGGGAGCYYVGYKHGYSDCTEMFGFTNGHQGKILLPTSTSP